MINVDLLGALAGICTTAAFAPQAFKVWRTRSVRDISLTMYILFCSGLILWLIYGYQIRAWPILVANSITLGLAGSVLVMKVIFQGSNITLGK